MKLSLHLLTYILFKSPFLTEDLLIIYESEAEQWARKHKCCRRECHHFFCYLVLLCEIIPLYLLAMCLEDFVPTLINSPLITTLMYCIFLIFISAPSSWNLYLSVSIYLFFKTFSKLNKI